MMDSQVQVSASLLSADFLHLSEDIRKSEVALVDSFHLDVMDGHLAPNLSYGPPVIRAIRQATSLPLDAHLMIDHPWLFLDDYIQLSVNSILIHAESYTLEPVNALLIQEMPRTTTTIDVPRLRHDLSYIRSAGIDAGVTLNPGTPISVLEPVLDFCDSVLLMSVNPGYSGQAFMPIVLDKIKALRTHYSGPIKVDGGINAETGSLVVGAGANVLITASYLFASASYSEAVLRLKTSHR